jgi:hypothetical protein
VRSLVGRDQTAGRTWFLPHLTGRLIRLRGVPVALVIAGAESRAEIRRTGDVLGPDRPGGSIHDDAFSRLAQRAPSYSQLRLNRWFLAQPGSRVGNDIVSYAHHRVRLLPCELAAKGLALGLFRRGRAVLVDGYRVVTRDGSQLRIDRPLLPWCAFFQVGYAFCF